MSFLRRSWKWIRTNTVQQVKSLDRASHPVTFTFNEDTEHKSFYGGLLALLVLVYLIILFSGNIQEIVMKSSIVAENIVKVDPKAETEKTTFGKGMMFAVGIEQLDFRYEKVFNLRFSSTKKMDKPRNRTEIKRDQTLNLIPCTPDIWEKLELLDYFKVNQLEQMLCPNPKDVLKLSQDDGYRLEIERCDPESPEPANSTAYIQSLTDAFNGFKNNPEWTESYETQFDMIGDEEDFADDEEQTDDDYFNWEENIEDEIEDAIEDEMEDVESAKVGSSPPSFLTAPCYFNFYQKLFKLPRQYRVQFFFVNTLINAEEEEYTKRYVEYQEFLIQLTNGSTLRTEADFYLDSYEVTTNNNIFNKFKYRMLKKKGFINIKPIEVHSFIYDPENIANLPNNTNSEKMNNYFTMDIKRSNQVLYVNRSFKTFEGLFKEIGGYLAFFGIIFTFLFLAYNQLSFELEIVSGLYFKERNKPIETSNINYFKFLIYKFWCLLGLINIKPKWEFCQEWEEVSGQATKIFDMHTVVKKLQHLEKVGKAVLDQDKYYALYLQEPQSLVDEKNKLEAEGFYNKLRQKYFSEGEINEDDLMKLRKAMAMRLYADPQASLNEEIGLNFKNEINPNEKMIKYESGSKVYDEADMLKFIEQLKDEDDENYIDEAMFNRLKKSLEKLKAESKVSGVAARIYEAIDPNVKCILLNEEIPTKEKRQNAEEILHEQSNDSLANPPRLSSKVFIQQDKKNEKGGK